MSDSTSNKPKKPVKRRKKTPKPPTRPVVSTKRKTKKEREIEEMASLVFKKQEENIEESTAEPKGVKNPIPNASTPQQPEESKDTGPVKFPAGLSRPTAFPIHKHALREIDHILEQYLGRADYDYFIHSENTMSCTH